MSTQTFGHPAHGAFTRSMAELPRAVVAAIAESVSWLNPRVARAELLKLADSRAQSDPQFAARLRKAAKANWFGEA